MAAKMDAAQDKFVDKNYVNNIFRHCLNQNNAVQCQGMTDLVANMLHQNNAEQSQGLKDLMQAEVQVIKDGMATNLGTLQTLLEKYDQVRGYVDYLFKTMTWANMDEHGNVIFKWDYMWARFLDYEKSQKEKYGTLEEVMRKLNARISTLEHEQAMHKDLLEKLHAKIAALEAQRLPKRFRGKKFRGKKFRGKKFRSRRSKKMPPKMNAGHFIVPYVPEKMKQELVVKALCAVLQHHGSVQSKENALTLRYALTESNLSEYESEMSVAINDDDLPDPGDIMTRWIDKSCRAPGDGVISARDASALMTCTKDLSTVGAKAGKFNQTHWYGSCYQLHGNPGHADTYSLVEYGLFVYPPRFDIVLQLLGWLTCGVAQPFFKTEQDSLSSTMLESLVGMPHTWKITFMEACLNPREEHLKYDIEPAPYTPYLIKGTNEYSRVSVYEGRFALFLEEVPHNMRRGLTQIAYYFVWCNMAFQPENSNEYPFLTSAEENHQGINRFVEEDTAQAFNFLMRVVREHSSRDDDFWNKHAPYIQLPQPLENISSSALFALQRVFL
jgi:hypothetical protein